METLEELNEWREREILKAKEKYSDPEDEMFLDRELWTIEKAYKFRIDTIFKFKEIFKK